MVHIVCGCIVLKKVYITGNSLVFIWNLGTEDKEG